MIAIAAVAILSSFEYLRVQRIRAGEYYGLILFGTVGMCLMSSAIELVLIFIALEISSISTYCLRGLPASRRLQQRIVAEILSAGILCDRILSLWRCAMFGATGSTNLDAISQVLRSGNVLSWHTLRPRLCLSAWDSRSPRRPFTSGLLTSTKALPLRLSG